MASTGLMSMPRPRHFIHRADGTMTPLVALDELPDFIQLKNVPARLSVAETQGMTSLGLESRSIGSYQVDQDLYEAANPTEKAMSDRTEQQGSVAQTVTEEFPASIAPSSVDVGVEEATDAQRSVDGWRRAINTESTKAPTTRAPSVASTIRQSTRGRRRATSRATIDRESRPYEPLTKGVLGRKEYCSHWIRKGECDFTQQGCIFKHVMPSLDKLEELGYRTYPRWFREAYDMTEENRENFGRGPKPKPEPEPVRHDPPQYRPQTPSVYNDLRSTYQAPMYGHGGPPSQFSAAGSRWPHDNYNRYQPAPIRGPPNGYQDMWNNSSQNVYGPRGPPFANQQQGYRAQPQVVYPTAQYPHRPTFLYAPNQLPSKAVGAPPIVVQGPTSGPGLTQGGHAPQPMKVDSLFQRFDGLSTAARQNITTSVAAATKVVNTPAFQQAPSAPEHQILSRPPTANTFKDFSVMQPSQPSQSSESQTKPAVVQSIAPQQPGVSTRGLYDGIPSVPGPRHTRRFVAPKSNNYQAPDANVETAKRQTALQDVKKRTGIQEVRRNIGIQDVRKEQPAPTTAVRILTREKHPAQATSTASAAGTQTQSTSTIAQAAKTTPAETADTSAHTSNMSKEQIDNAFPSSGQKPANPVAPRVRTSPRRHNTNGHGNGNGNGNSNGHVNVKGRGRRMHSVDLVDLGA
ncbi:hypothetical protein MMC17_008789 [Xylographa soralifera]|nr:hypothetical protein [Xylographa soralifera]